MVQGLWDRQVNAIIDVKLGDSDAYTYKYDPITSLLSRWENIKKYKHGKHCNDQQKNFAVCSVSGQNAREAITSHALLNNFVGQIQNYDYLIVGVTLP